MIKSVLPPATLGIVGGGQLGQMIALAAKPMGYRVIVLDPSPEAPAGQVADRQIIANYDDQAAMQDLAREADVVTYEFENVDRDTLATVLGQAELPQGLRLLELTGDRLQEKNFLKSVGLPVVPFEPIEQIVQLDAACQKVGLPAILKTTTGGYDGHGQWDIPDQQALAELVAHWDGPSHLPMILEKRVTFERELSVMVTRDGLDQIHTWPISENEHENHVLKWSFAPANVSATLGERIEGIATTLAEALELRGVLGVELFVSGDEVYVNELAPRPHNSGHYTLEGTSISQFEGHVRSVMGLPIPKIEVHDQALMLNLLGEAMMYARQSLPVQPTWHFHDYGKKVAKPGRKMGHITVLGQEAMKTLKKWGGKHD